MDGLSRAIIKAEKKQGNKETTLHKMLRSDVEQKPHKYHIAEKQDRTYSDGTVFASKKEMDRWHLLRMVEKSGEIKDLKRQVPFILQEEFISKQWGEQKPIIYIADFVYKNITFRKNLPNFDVVEDVKGIKTRDYNNKKKIFLYRFGFYLFFEV